MAARSPVFVIGTGRSGTSWLGDTLGLHPQIRSTVEIQPIFGLSTRMALNPALEKRLLIRLVAAYRWQLIRSLGRVYADKTHPNIWIAEKLKRAFPNSVFLGIERNPYATVASMIKHAGVSEWHKRWREFPVPNRFLGITVETANRYDEIPFASKCAMRWLAHHDRMNDLKRTLGEDLLVIPYETFAQDTRAILDDIRQFLGLRSEFPMPEVKTQSLDKWKSQLSDEELMQIQEIVGVRP